MNFRNSNPPAAFKTSRIISMLDATEANNRLGSDLVNEADSNLQNATRSFAKVQDVKSKMEKYTEEFNKKQESDRRGIEENCIVRGNPSHTVPGL